MRTSVIKAVLVGVMFLGLAEVVNAQHEYQPKIAVKWSPLHMMYFYPSVQMGLEHRISKALSIQYDGGIIINYPQTNDENYANKRGYRFTGELRYYIPSPPKIPMYVAAEGHFAEAKFNRQGVIGYNCAGECSYYEYRKYTVKASNEGFGFKFGILLYPGWNRNKKFFFDLNLGIAQRWIKYDKSEQPILSDKDTFFNEDRAMFSPSEETRSEPRPVAGVRIGFRLL